MINTTEPSHRTTLQDIADHCGLSRSTVARVLNGNAGKFRIAAVTIEKVQLAAQKLNYRPNRLARAVNDRPESLFQCMPAMTSPLFIMERSRSKPCRIRRGNSLWSLKAKRNHLRSALNRQRPNHYSLNFPTYADKTMDRQPLEPSD